MSKKPTLTVQLMHAHKRIAELEEARDEAVMLYRNAKRELDEARPAQPAPSAAIKTVAHRALPAHFAAAREAAMRLGKCVKVTA